MRNVFGARTLCVCALVLVGATPILFVGGCDDGNDTNLPGPCYHENRTPIVEIASVAVPGSDMRIEEFRILAITIDGRPMDLAGVTDFGRLHEGVEFVDSVLNCAVPCAFGDESGHYELVLEADGVPQQTVAFDAQYVRCWGNCPSFCEGATEVHLQLESR